MPATEAQANSPQNTQANFTQTHWSLVVQAANSSSPEAREKLNELCQKYWYPLYAFIRRQGHDSHKAKDLTQSFFVHLLEKDLVKRASPQKGKFRSFLLASLTNFMRDEWRKENAQVRGGAIASISIDEVEAERKYHSLPAHEPDASKIFDRSWAVTLIERATKQLREKYADKIQVYDALQPYLSGESGRGFYAKVAEKLKLADENAVGVLLHRMRKEFGEILVREIAQTTVDPREVHDELRYLLEAWAGSPATTMKQ